MTQEHDDIRADLPALAARRLAPERRQVIERHVAGCLECQEAVADFEAIAAGIAGGGDALFAPHPESAALRRIALAGRGAEDEAIRRHLDACATCSLEVESWRKVAVRAPIRWHSRARREWAWVALGAAAGIVLGVLLGTLSRWLPPAAPARPAPDVGQPVLYLLPETLRDNEPAGRRWDLDPADPYFGVAFPIVIPASAGGEEMYRIELRLAGGAVVWSTEMSASRLRAHLRSADVVHIAAIPTRVVAPGRYNLVVRPAGDAGAALLYRAVIEISYRQSPAATKAPQ